MLSSPSARRGGEGVKEKNNDVKMGKPLGGFTPPVGRATRDLPISFTKELLKLQRE